MAEKDWLLGDNPNPLGDRVAEIRENLELKNPERLAKHTGAIYTPKGDKRGEFRLTFWSREILVNFPDFNGIYTENDEEINTFDLTMLVYYFDIVVGIPLSREWISFNQIPGGDRKSVV